MAAGDDGVKMSTKNSRGKGREKKGTDKEERQQGGPGRDLDVLIEIELSKVLVVTCCGYMYVLLLPCSQVHESA